MTKLGIKLLGVLSLGILLIFAEINGHSLAKTVLAYTSGPLWPYYMPGDYSGGQVVATPAKSVIVQDLQDPQAPPESSKHCERPNPNNPDVGDKDKDKLGCTCMRKCVAGKPTENYEQGKTCKSHCKPDQCDCPNPCKT